MPPRASGVRARSPPHGLLGCVRVGVCGVRSVRVTCVPCYFFGVGKANVKAFRLQGSIQFPSPSTRVSQARAQPLTSLRPSSCFATMGQGLSLGLRVGRVLSSALVRYSLRSARRAHPAHPIGGQQSSIGGVPHSRCMHALGLPSPDLVSLFPTAHQIPALASAISPQLPQQPCAEHAGEARSVAGPACRGAAHDVRACAVL